MEPLSDPLNDRVMKDVPAPPHRPLTLQIGYDSSQVPNVSVIKDHLVQEGQLEKALLMRLIQDASAHFQKEPNLVRISGGKTIVVGDIHGQFFDLAYIFSRMPALPSAHLLFLGDYVDRGLYSVEVVALLYAVKAAFPGKVTLLRGNHECRSMTEFFTFREECLRKFDVEVYEAFMDSFDLMPVAAVVDDEYFCVHGGISPHMNDIYDLQALDRAQEPPIEGLVCDLLWSDPIDDIYANSTEFRDNPERECSYYFGNKPVKELLRERGLVSVIRGHQVQLEGYKMHRWNGMANFPSVITVFSAPDYCGFHSNRGAILVVEGEKIRIKQYRETKGPYHLPNDLDLIQWSLPYLANKVAQMLYYLITTSAEYTPSSHELEDIDFGKLQGHADPKSKVERQEVLRTKVKAVAKLARMFKSLKQNSDILLEIKEMAPDGKIPQGLLLKGRGAMKDQFKEYLLARDLDRDNEKRPQIPTTTLSNQSNDSMLI